MRQVKTVYAPFVAATIIPAPSSTTYNATRRESRDESDEAGNQWYFGMKALIGVDAESGSVHVVSTTAVA